MENEKTSKTKIVVAFVAGVCVACGIYAAQRFGWVCKTLQNYKALLSTTVSGDGIYAEYTYNGDKQEMYEDVYKKDSNRCLKSE